MKHSAACDAAFEFIEARWADPAKCPICVAAHADVVEEREAILRICDDPAMYSVPEVARRIRARGTV